MVSRFAAGAADDPEPITNPAEFRRRFHATFRG
jgi:hypothetical protein